LVAVVSLVTNYRVVNKQSVEQLITFFPEVQLTTSSSPLICSTKPSIQASSGSSTQTWEPTTKRLFDACNGTDIN